MDYKVIDPNTVQVQLEKELNMKNADMLKKQLTGLYRQGYQNFVLDFTNIKKVDSTGIGKMLMFHKLLKDSGGKLKIVNIKNTYVKSMFEMINLDKVIKID